MVLVVRALACTSQRCPIYIGGAAWLLLLMLDVSLAGVWGAAGAASRVHVAGDVVSSATLATPPPPHTHTRTRTTPTPLQAAVLDGQVRVLRREVDVGRAGGDCGQGLVPEAAAAAAGGGGRRLQYRRTSSCAPL